MAKNIDTVKNFITAATNIVQALGEVNPREDEFDSLLDKHTQVCRAALNYMDLQERVSFFLGQMGEIEQEVQPDNITVIKPSPANWVAKKPEEKTADDEPVEDFPASDEDPYPEATPTYTAEEVKEAFTKAARDGVNVAVIINELGYEKLSAVPAEKFPTLMEQLDLAIKEKS